MAYALFANSEKVSKAFPTKSEVWQHADESGLVSEVGVGEEDPPRRVLDMNYTIGGCALDPVEHEPGSGMSEHDIAQLIAGCRVSQPSATAAS